MDLNNAYLSIELNNEKESILKLRSASNAAIARKDAECVASIWTSDFIQIAGDGSLSKGKAKVLSEWKFMFKQSSPLFERLPDQIEIGESLNMAWETGKWRYLNEKFYGNYSAMWKKINGKWFTHSELYVSLNK